MTMLAKVFQNGRSQAIRIPKECRVDSDEVYIEKIGDRLIIKPKHKDKWDSFFDNLDTAHTNDFLTSREQLEVQQRDMF